MHSTCNLDKVKGALDCDTLAREKGICKQTALHNACDVLLCSFAVAWLRREKSASKEWWNMLMRNQSESSWLVVLVQLQTILILVLICPQGSHAFMEGGELIINQNIRFQHFQVSVSLIPASLSQWPWTVRRKVNPLIEPHETVGIRKREFMLIKQCNLKKSLARLGGWS